MPTDSRTVDLIIIAGYVTGRIEKTGKIPSPMVVFDFAQSYAKSLGTELSDDELDHLHECISQHWGDHQKIWNAI